MNIAYYNYRYPKEIVALMIIFQQVCRHFQISVEMAMLHDRKRELKTCRQVSHYIARQTIKTAPLGLIGRIIGDVDHATVMYSIGEVKNKISPLKNGIVPDKELRRDVAILNLKVQKIFQLETLN